MVSAAGNAAYEDDDPVWQQLVSDFPFLQRTVSGTARDLGPYERPADNGSSGIATVKTAGGTDKPLVRKYVQQGRLVIEKDGSRYNALGQRK